MSAAATSAAAGAAQTHQGTPPLTTVERRVGRHDHARAGQRHLVDGGRRGVA